MGKNFFYIFSFNFYIFFRFNSKNFDLVVLENAVSQYAASRELKMSTLNRGPIIPHMRLKDPKTKVALVFKGGNIITPLF